MVLNGEETLVGVGETFQTVVVEAGLRRPPARFLKALSIDGKAVVLARDLDAARIKVEHGMVGAVMAELEPQPRATTAGRPD